MSRLDDILAELTDLRRIGNALCAEAATLHVRKIGQHVNTDRGQGVIVHVSVKESRDGSHFVLTAYEHISMLTPGGRPSKKRLVREYQLAEEWLTSSLERENERREFKRNQGAKQHDLLS